MLKSEREARPGPEREFDESLLDSIDEGLADILGERVKGTFYKLIEQKFNMARSSLPNRLDVLASVLSAVLGNSGALVMDKAIAKRFYSRLGLQFVQKPNHSLQNYVTDAKMVMLTK
jgi:hypothetical protein